MELLDYIKIDLAKESDYVLIHQVETTLFQQEYSKKSFFKMLLKMNNRYDYVCKLEDMMIGYITIIVYEDTADMLSLYVHKHYRRKGCAKALVEEAINKHLTKNGLKVTLEVRVSNQTAIQFYQNLGFDIISRRSEYYQDREDAWVMQLIKE
jgi:ribosomal-protein-alanine N-acetyltransferase